MSRLNYRKEIDGLRALAVLPVIFFHLNIDSFVGGYLGVDIFFVISGYLITSIIYLELKNSTFSILNFYERRIRRIIPVLSTVIFFTIPFSWYLMTPVEFKDYVLSIISTILFFSNILFWNQSDYFDTSSEFKPLLHTWSLSIEEQFYIIFPIILVILFRFYKKYIFKLLIITFLFSYLLAIYASLNFESANFYLLPTRAWEILSGSISAILLIKYPEYLKKAFKNKQKLITLIGLLLIIFSFYFFDSSTKHPGLGTFIPVMGTVLIILSTPNNGLINKFLSQKVMVYIGLLSYSLYLWHVPLITFIKIYKQEELLFTDKVFVIVMTIVLSLLTYNFIEKNYKNKNLYSTKKIYSYFLISLLVLLSFSTTIYFTDLFTNNIENRLDEESLYLYELISEHTSTDIVSTRYDNNDCKFLSLEIDEKFIERFDNCIKTKNEKAIILFGDSHAMNVHNIAYTATDSNFFVTIATGGLRIKFNEDEFNMKEISDFINNYKSNIKTVYYHQSGSYLVEDYKGRVDSAEIFNPNKKYLIKSSDITYNFEFLSSLPVQTIWIGPFMESRQDFLRQVIGGKKEFDIPISHKLIFNELDQVILGFKNQKVVYVPFNEIFELVTTDVFIDNCLIYRDGDHLSLCGENYIGQRTDFFIDF